jgi:tight adherence protein B
MSAALLAAGAMVAFAVALLVFVANRAYGDYRAKFTETAKVSMEDLFLFVDPQAVFNLNLGLFLVIPVGTWLVTGSPPLVLLSALIAGVLPRLIYAFMRRRRLFRLVEQLPDALTMLAGSLRAGGSLQMAMELVVHESPAPLSQEFSVILREQRLGMSLEDSLDGMSKRLHIEDVELFVSAMTIAKDVGGNLSEILERLAATLRAKAVMEGKIRALTSQGKLQGIVVGCLPIFLAGVLYVMDPVAMLPLFTTLYGWGVMAGVFVLLMLGAFFIRKIVTIDV